MKNSNQLRFNRRNILKVVAGSAMLFISPAIASGRDTIRAIYRLTTTSIMATDTPFAERYDLTIEPVKSVTGIEANEVLMTGAVDVAEVGTTPFVTLLSRSSDIVAIGVSSSGGGMYRTVVRTESPYQTMDDLRGKKIAIKLGSGNYAAFLTYIATRGWQEHDFQLVNSGDQEAIAALTAGSVDAVIYWEPIVSVLIAKGIARPIFNFEGVVENPVFLITTRDAIASKSEALAKYVATFMDGQQVLAEDAPEAARLVTAELRKAGQQIEEEAIRLSIPSVRYNIELTPTARSEAKRTWDLLRKTEKLRGAEPDWAAAFDDRFIAAAKTLRRK